MIIDKSDLKKEVNKFKHEFIDQLMYETDKSIHKNIQYKISENVHDPLEVIIHNRIFESIKINRNYKEMFD